MSLITHKSNVFKLLHTLFRKMAGSILVKDEEMSSASGSPYSKPHFAQCTVCGPSVFCKQFSDNNIQRRHVTLCNVESSRNMSLYCENDEFTLHVCFNKEMLRMWQNIRWVKTVSRSNCHEIRHDLIHTLTVAQLDTVKILLMNAINIKVA